MINCMEKRKIKNEVLENRKKIAMYAGAITLSTAGVYLPYKAIKKIKNKHKDDIQYLEYEEDKTEDFENQELKEKIDEFNSRRICSENHKDSSPEEINKYTHSIKDDKENVEINENEYESEKYENYEDDIEK